MKKTIKTVFLFMFTACLFISCSDDDDDNKVKTVDNLKSAITGETDASNKYAAFSQKAKEEGFINISKMFAAASFAEKVHIDNHNRVLVKMGNSEFTPTAPDVTIKNTAGNLQTGIDGETYEFTEMYPAFLKVAEQEKLEDAVRTFQYADKAEQVHAKKYQYVLDIFNMDLNDENIPNTWYVCPVCGNLHYTLDGLDACEICGVKTSMFVLY